MMRPKQACAIRSWALIYACSALLTWSVASQAGDPKATKPASVLIELDGSGSRDPDGDTLRYDWRQVDGPRVVLSNPNSPKPYFRTSRPGRYLFELRVSDGNATSAPALVEVTVERENLRPEAQVTADVEFVEGQTVTIDGSKSRDADGDELRYLWRQVSGPPLYFDKQAVHQPILSFPAKRAGVYELELVVADGRVCSRPARCRLVIRPRNKAPVACIKAPTCAVLERSVDEIRPDFDKDKPTAYIEKTEYANVGEEVVLDGSGSNAPSKKPLRYYWKQRSGPFVRTFDRSEDERLRFTPQEAGEYTFELVVSDGEQDSLAAIRSLKVGCANAAPIAVIEAPACAATGTLVKLDGSHSYDKEGSALEYAWRQVSGPAVLHYVMDKEGSNSTPGFVPTEDGTYTFELVVSDGQRRSRPATASIQVGAANRCPQARVAGNLTVAPGEVAILQAAGEDADGDSLTYTWRQVGGPALLEAPAMQQSLTLTPKEEGLYTFEVVVSDGAHASRPAICTMTVARQSLAGPPPDLPAVPTVDPAELLVSEAETKSAPSATAQANDKKGGKAVSRFFQRFVKPFHKSDQEPINPDISTAAPAAPAAPEWAR